MPNARQHAVSPSLAVVLGGLAAGVIDITYACTFWAIKAGVRPSRIFQSVAAGLLGRQAAVAGGAPTAALGLVLHFFIALTVAVVYYTAARSAEALWRRPWVFGSLYGVAVFGVMHYIVVPLSAAGGRRASLRPRSGTACRSSCTRSGSACPSRSGRAPRSAAACRHVRRWPAPPEPRLPTAARGCLQYHGLLSRHHRPKGWYRAWRAILPRIGVVGGGRGADPGALVAAVRSQRRPAAIRLHRHRRPRRPHRAHRLRRRAVEPLPGRDHRLRRRRLRLRRRRLDRHLPGQRLDAGGLSRRARRRPAISIGTGATAPSRT